MVSPSPDAELHRIESRFEGPGCTHSGNQVVISVVLEPGAEKRFSGIQVVVCCREDVPERHKLTVKDDVGRVQFVRWQREQEPPPPGVAKQFSLAFKFADPNEDLLLQQEAAHKASDTLLAQGLPASELPLYTVAYEVQDMSSDTWHCATLVLLPSWPPADGTYRIAYQFVQPTHDPVVLYLSLSHSLRRTLKPNNESGIVCAYPASRGIFAFAVRVCPPQAQRRPFTQPPPEILSAIFACAAKGTYESGRPALVSLALVCHAWVIALEHLFHDFGSYTSKAPDLVALAKAVQAKPRMGSAIRHLSRSHFGRDPDRDAQRYLELAIAFKDVLHSAKHVRTLEIFDTHPSLREEFVQALGQSRDVRNLLINRYSLSDEQREYRCQPTLPDLFRCFQRWPRLHKLELYGWDGPNPFLQTVEQFTIEQTPPLDCALSTIRLATGPITGPQLCNLTAGSHASLTEAYFSGLIGLSNAGLKEWLVQLAPTLQRLHIKQCSIARASDEEEYALDAAMGTLTALSDLHVDGDILSELAVLRKTASGAATPRPRSARMIHLENCPGVSPHGLVQAMKHTGWNTIRARQLFEGNQPLFEEAEAVAKERGLSFCTYIDKGCGEVFRTRRAAERGRDSLAKLNADGFAYKDNIAYKSLNLLQVLSLTVPVSTNVVCPVGETDVFVQSPRHPMPNCTASSPVSKGPEPGAEKRFSGIQVVVCCRENVPELHKLTVKDDVGRVQFVRWQGTRATAAGSGQTIFLGLQVRGSERRSSVATIVQEAAHKASDTLLAQGLPASELPLYTVAYEVATLGCATLVLLPSWPPADGTYRIAYQFVQLTHDPVVLYLSLSHSLRRTLKPNNESGIVCVKI
ncbi:hypothetical protein GGX14DRAFT_674743 [Mycena pura]|uniref:Uncharacterized protein n=1 Tax=Mycena pura TaxID=153505 RepID=A0AAD6UZH5_9AGAR|nr:hypothetical protein GGX14DRAFT_674743 [Mycena pura]